MPSLAARIVDLSFRLLMLPKLESSEKFIAHGRRALNLVRLPARLPSGITIRKTTIGNEPGVPPGIPAICVSTPSPTATVLYIHGGAFIGGKFQTYAGLCGKLAHCLNARVYWIDYRLAPEMPYPAASDDAFQAYRALARDFPKDPVSIIGDSAGGNLTLSTLLRVRDTLAVGQHDQSLRMPACAVSMSPLTDFASEPPSWQANERSDCALTAQIIRFARDAYVATNDPRVPYISPARGDLNGLPPVMLTVSENEVVRDDTYRFAHRARKAGVAVRILSRWNTPHAWPVLQAIIPEGRDDVREICRFMNDHLKANTTVSSVVTPLHQAIAS